MYIGMLLLFIKVIKMISQINIKDHTANFQAFVASKYAMHCDTQAFINGEKVSSLINKNMQHSA